jgi:hypothetical protein
MIGTKTLPTLRNATTAERYRLWTAGCIVADAQRRCAHPAGGGLERYTDAATCSRSQRTSASVSLRKITGVSSCDRKAGD